MQHKDKPQKSKVRTLCTIDTSDIDLQDVKSKNYNFISLFPNKNIEHK